MSLLYHGWTVLPVPAPAGAYAVTLYAPGAEVKVGMEADVTPLEPTYALALTAAFRKIDAREDGDTSAQATLPTVERSASA